MKILLKSLPTVGKKREIYLNKIGIYNVEDLLYYTPREIQDRRSLNFSVPLYSLQEGQKITIIGKFITFNTSVAKNNLGIFKVVVETIVNPKKLFVLTWFKKLNRKYDVFATIKKQIHLKKNDSPDVYIIAYGKVSEVKGTFVEIIVEDYEILSNLSQDSIHTNRLVPVYSLNENLSQQWFRELIYYTIQNYKLEEFIPQKILSTEKLLDINSAIKNIHFPDTWQMYNESKKRLIFEKFLLLQAAVLKVKKNVVSKPKVGNYVIKRTLLTPFKERLKSIIPNFDFTNAQKKVINELFKDMLSKKPMNRLLIGDVGSGKTIVAVSCALLAVENGYQVAFMVPTEVLAEQHYYNLLQYTENLFNPEKKRNVNIAVLSGKTKSKHKKEILDKIASGEIDIVVGTHALIEEKVKFKNLSLVIIDEQHKFGVLQRKKLYQKSVLPDMIVMTATPIPRSLSMALYGELDISIIDELPYGRKPIKTFFYDIDEYDYKLVLERLQHNEKVYIVYPIIEESKLELKTLVDEYNKLSNTIFKGYKCGLLHGKLKSQQKEEVMIKFKHGEYQILFCTPVIEVGVDIPDATVIVINHAERFGLAQLHQLRGRVGRSDKQSYCILVGKLSTEEAKRRIDTIISTNDGFKISREDLLIRGSGKIFGTLQHGKSEIDFDEILEYPELLSKARKYAEQIIFNKDFRNEDLSLFFKKLYSKYAKNFDLASIG